MANLWGYNPETDKWEKITKTTAGDSTAVDVVLRGNDGSITGTETNPVYINSGSIRSDYTETEPSGDSIGVVNKATAHTFHNAASAAADGTVFECNGEFNKVIIEITRATVTSNEVQFLGSIAGTNYYPLLGVKIGTDASLTTNVKSTATTSEMWEIDCQGMKSIKMDLTAIVDGTVSIEGVAI